MNKEIQYLVVILNFVGLVLSAQLQAQTNTTNPNGHNKFYYKNGQLSSEGKLRNGKPEGIWKNYYESGILKSEGSRVGHLLEGKWKFFSEHEILIEEIEYLEGKRNGKTNTYSIEGFLAVTTEYKEDKKNGLEFTFYSNGSVRKETPYNEGREHGVAYEFSPQEDIISIKTFENGILTRQEIINRRNKENQKQGLWKEFFKDRTVSVEGRFRNDKKEGYWKEYGQNGDLLQTYKYEKGELIKDAEELSNLNVRELYHEGEDGEGYLKYRGTYREGKAHGVHLWFAEDGSVDSAKIYRNDYLIAEGRMDVGGLKQGDWKEYYYPTGELKAIGIYQDGYRYNRWVYYYKSSTVEQRGSYNAKGKPSGLWNWFYENGQLLREETFKNGKEHGMLIEYNDTAKVVTRGEYIDGLEEGEWLYEIGDHKEVGKYEYGTMMGRWEHTYLTTGETLFRGEYFEDLSQGKHTWYYDTGKKMLEGEFISGIKEGPWRRYNKDGTIMITIEYRQGREIRVDGLRVKDPEEKGETEEVLPE